MKCRSCKMDIPNDWKACPNCGLSTDPKASQPSTPQAQPYKKLINVLLIAGIALYLLLKLRS